MQRPYRILILFCGAEPYKRAFLLFQIEGEVLRRHCREFYIHNIIFAEELDCCIADQLSVLLMIYKCRIAMTIVDISSCAGL